MLEFLRTASALSLCHLCACVGRLHVLLRYDSLKNDTSNTCAGWAPKPLSLAFCSGLHMCVSEEPCVCVCVIESFRLFFLVYVFFYPPFSQSHVLLRVCYGFFLYLKTAI